MAQDPPGDWRAAIKFVVSVNIARRHLSTGERADEAAAVANLKPGGDQSALARIGGVTQDGADVA